MWSFVTGSLLSMFPRCNSIKYIGTLLIFIEKKMFMHLCISLWKRELFSFFSYFSSPSIYIQALCNKNTGLLLSCLLVVFLVTQAQENILQPHIFFFPFSLSVLLPQVNIKREILSSPSPPLTLLTLALLALWYLFLISPDITYHYNSEIIYTTQFSKTPPIFV